MTEVEVYMKHGELFKTKIEDSERVVAYLADGRLFETKQEAEQIDADYDLKHFINRMCLDYGVGEEIYYHIKTNKSELMRILIKL